MFIPAHITGFFKIYKDKDLLKTGSTGAGITLNKGVSTNIVEGNEEIYFNGDKTQLCPTIEVIKNCMNYLNHTNLNTQKSNRLNKNNKIKYKLSNKLDNNFNNLNEFNYNIIHKSDFPLGCGLGTSGACALGVSYELCKIYNAESKILEFAHGAEVKCGTGLGDVVAQYTGGFVIRKKPGLPLNVEKINIKNINNYNVVVEILGKKETNKIINNADWINKINNVSDNLLQKLLKNPTLKNFMSLSYTFAKDTGLATDKIISLCDDLSFTIGSSQAMLGNTVFCICEDKDLNDVLSILNNPIVCKIYNEGNYE
ncbi:pantoate kinase [Methanothermococcus okinawensis]|uniref:Pantoate kinase n=1 Tax=Methanothermococcus okinawensis (strain DSM 14208 / JCM 11175 / IH1) TaxID=647113 RepID=F8AKH3_METOI|nr:pantoate kinase [Methanothermococcus okinawensis]AEH07499.1 GHMP kinase [Methanothermococcus okinawensis IH1]